jgi:REP element-mobilizing transposase RayT
VNWIDVFTRDIYFSCIVESLDFCRKNKGMEIYGYCIMPSHIHLIFRSSNNDPSGLIRDFKGFTSKKMINLIRDNTQESRKEWLLWMLERAGKKNSNLTKYQFWQQNNHPIEIWTLKVFEQKLNYVHQNPVQTGFVTDPIDYKYSSARNYGNDDQTVLEIDLN